MKNKLLNYVFLLTTLAAAVFAVLFQRRGDRIKSLHSQIQREKIKSKLSKARDAMNKAGGHNVKANRDYHATVRKYRSLSKKLGLKVD